ncbi:MAG: hypothetical protein J5487_01390 [Lachnospiraceae bacterium]|nr:hypothetical protein [Lachnospiraceae bacterium]
MKNNRFVGALAAVTVIVALCAGLVFKVSLAKPLEADATGDKLIGVFVTEDYVDTFDIDAYLNDNADALLGGDVIVSPGDSQKYSGRIYAVRTEEPWVSEDGTEHISSDYNFEGIDGLRCFMVTENAAEEDEYGNVNNIAGRVVRILASDMECASSSNIRSDEGNPHSEVTESELNCTIYAFPNPGKEVIGIYCNPVYQDAFGNVYMVSGQGISCSNDGYSVGLTISSSIDNSYTETDTTGKTVTEKVSVNVKLSVISEPASYTFTQYDASGAAIDSQNYNPASIPATLKVAGGCEYIVVTENLKNGETKRSLVDKEAPSYTYYVPSGRSYAERKTCEAIWP